MNFNIFARMRRSRDEFGDRYASKILPLNRFNEHEIEVARELMIKENGWNGHSCRMSAEHENAPENSSISKIKEKFEDPSENIGAENQTVVAVSATVTECPRSG